MTELDTIPTGQDAPIQLATVEPGVMDKMREYAESLAVANQLAEQIARTDYAGPFKGKPADLGVAILKGAALGIGPTEVGKAIYVVHGSPALYGKTALGIARAQGYRFDRDTYTPQEVTVTAHAPNGDTDQVTYTYERAQREGLVKGNKQQYETRPEKMLYWKCIGELADQFFPHLLNGMPIKEDWEQSQPIHAPSRRIDRPTGAQGARAALGLGAEPESAAEPATDTPAPATPEQLQELAALLDQEGLTEGPAKLAWLTEQFGRDITSATDLTATEANDVTAFLKEDK